MTVLLIGVAVIMVLIGLAFAVKAIKRAFDNLENMAGYTKNMSEVQNVTLQLVMRLVDTVGLKPIGDNHDDTLPEAKPALDVKRAKVTRKRVKKKTNSRKGR